MSLPSESIPPANARREPQDHASVGLWLDQTRVALVTAGIVLVITGLVTALIDGDAGLRDLILRDIERPMFLLELLMGLLLAPPLETALMGWLILLMLDKGMNRVTVMCVSATLWAALHVVLTDSSQWIIAIPFFFFSLVYIKRKLGEHRDGFVVATMSHFYYNVVASASTIALFVNR